jgi:glutamine amidotransferase-like uncharacterized protein
MSLSDLLSRRRQMIEMKGLNAATEFIHECKDAIKIAYFIYEKDAKCNTFMKFVEKLRHAFTIVQTTPYEILEQNILCRDGFHILFVGGGMPAEHYRQLQGERGSTIIREFVGEFGGAYVGVCAGAYTAIHWHQEEPLKSFSPSWELLPNCFIRDRIGHNWKRGMGRCSIRLTPLGATIFQSNAKIVDMFFRNGPLFECSTDTNTSSSSSSTFPSSVQVLGTFENEINTEKNPNACMIGSAAIVYGTFGKGQVLLFSAHPESSDDHVDSLLVNSFKYVATSSNNINNNNNNNTRKFESI